MSDKQYLISNLGSSLQYCLSEVCKLQPSDPIETLACLLLKHKKNEDFARESLIQTQLEDCVLKEEERNLLLQKAMREEEMELSKSQLDLHAKEKDSSDRRRSSAFQPSLRVVEESKLEQ